MRRLTPSSCLVSFQICIQEQRTKMDILVGEKDEVSIKDVADSIVKAMDFQGEYSVSS